MVWYGIFGFALIMVSSFRRRTDRYEDFCVATFILVFLLLLTSVGTVEGALRPLTMDSILRSWDLALGFDGFALTRFFSRHPALWIPISTAYNGLPLVFALNWILERSKLFLRSAIWGGVLAFPLYILVPACGPKYAFVGYPWHSVVQAGFLAVSAARARNCFPSMHFSWALLLAMNARGKSWRAALLVYCAFVMLGTVASGEHYFVDLIVAAPFAFFVQFLAEKLSAWQESRRGIPEEETTPPSQTLPTSSFCVTVGRVSGEGNVHDG